MSTVQLPRLLDDNFLEITRLHPDKLSVDLLLSSVSTASMSVSLDDEKIEVGQFVELFTAQGSAGIFVVKSVAYEPDTRRQDAYLEHGVATLANNLMEGEEEKEGTARELLTALLGCQTRRLWQLGVVESSETLKWSCDYSNVLESIVNLMEQLPTYALTFDQSSMPWVLNLVRMTNADACECRLTRNMESLTVDIDRTDLCTRLYIRGIGKKKKQEDEKPPDKGEGESPGEGEAEKLPPLEDFVLPPQDKLVERYSETIEADTMATWGIVERVLEADMELPLDELMRQGRIYLEERKNPAITITLDAFDLHQATGEPFDRFHLGRICRVCLPEYAAVIRHRVVGMTYTDALSEPERVTVTLATQRADGIDTIAGIIVNTTLHSEQIGRLQINKIAANGWLELEADYIRLMAKHIILEADRIDLLAKEILLQADKIDLLAKEINLVAEKVDINAENIRLWGEITDELRESFAEINIDVENALIELRAGLKEITDMGDRISSAEILIDGANAKIDLYAQRTDETIEGLDRRISTAEILIDGANAAIELKASQEDVDDLDRRITSAEIDIDGANAAITLKASKDEVDGLDRRVSSAEIAINGLESEITLKADKIDLQGFVTADELETKTLEVVNGTRLNSVRANTINAGELSVDGNILAGDIFTTYVGSSEGQINTLSSTIAQAETLWATGAHIATLNATDVILSTVNGYSASRATLSVVVTDPQIVVAKETITYLDEYGSPTTIQVVTGAALQTASKGTISYLQLI